MGNRAFVVFETSDGLERSPATYLHWNGGPESIYAFLDSLIKMGGRKDAAYASARFTQIVGNFFGGTLSVGLHNSSMSNAWPRDLSEEDNGLYLVDLTSNPTYSVKRAFNGEWLSDEDVGKEHLAAMAHPTYAEVRKDVERTSGAFFKRDTMKESWSWDVEVVLKKRTSAKK